MELWNFPLILGGVVTLKHPTLPLTNMETFFHLLTPSPASLLSSSLIYFSQGPEQCLEHRCCSVNTCWVCLRRALRLVLPLTICMVLGKSLPLSEPQFPHS